MTHSENNTNDEFITWDLCMTLNLSSFVFLFVKYPNSAGKSMYLQQRHHSDNATFHTATVNTNANNN